MSMSQKLLQKTSNNFLQLALPENLIANKRIGKREKYRTRPGASYKNHSRMEGSLFRQWLLSWNTLKEKTQEEQGMQYLTKSLGSFRAGQPLKETKKNAPFIELSASLPQITWSRPHAMPWDLHNLSISKGKRKDSICHGAGAPCEGGKRVQPVFLVAPAFHIISHRINRAVGGNIIQHLNQYVKSTRLSFRARQPLEGAEKYVPMVPDAMPVPSGGLLSDSREKINMEEPFFFLEKGLHCMKKQEKNLHSPASPCCTAQQVQGVDEDYGELAISRAPYYFPENQRSTAADYLGEHIKFNNFHMIYSLQEKGKAGNKRDKISDDYRNQLAEWRKIAFLYGDLPKKTIVRAMHRAKRLAGDVDSNFLSLLETRLDVALKRAFFFSTLRAARQWIKCGKIKVNNLPITRSGCLLQPGDFITICPSAQSDWKKQCLRTLATIGEKKIRGEQWIFQPNAKARNRSHPMASSKNSKGNVPFRLGKANGTDYQVGFPKGKEEWNSLKKERRFPFSPLLMRKWKEWSALWGNSRYCFSYNADLYFPKEMRKGHQWQLSGKSTGLKNGVANPGDSINMLLYFFSSSTFASYLSATKKTDEKKKNAHIKNKQAQVEMENRKTPHVCTRQISPPCASPSPFPRGNGGLMSSLSTHLESNPFFFGHPLLLRPETVITNLLSGGGISKTKKTGSSVFPFPEGKAVAAFALAAHEKTGQRSSLFLERFPTPQETGNAQGMLGNQKTISASRANIFTGKTALARERNRCCQLLHQQQSYVVDGLYSLRWNKVFATKKSILEKKHHWRWSCIKPIHLECSYKHSTFIFLYSPQKLAWPGSINVSLLRKTVGE